MTSETLTLPQIAICRHPGGKFMGRPELVFYKDKILIRHLSFEGLAFDEKVLSFEHLRRMPAPCKYYMFHNREGKLTELIDGYQFQAAGLRDPVVLGALGLYSVTSLYMANPERPETWTFVFNQDPLLSSEFSIRTFDFSLLNRLSEFLLPQISLEVTSAEGDNSALVNVIANSPDANGLQVALESTGGFVPLRTASVVSQKAQFQLLLQGLKPGDELELRVRFTSGYGPPVKKWTV